MKRFLSTVLLVSLVALAFGQAAPGDINGRGLSFIPDYTFKGSSLTGWKSMGGATWRAENGEIIGTATPGSTGGWLLSDKSFQDVTFNTLFKIIGESEGGILLRAEKTPEGIKGILLSVKDGVPAAAYRVVLDAQGKELKRDMLRPAPGGISRFAVPLATNATASRGGGNAAGAPGGRGAAGAAAGRGGAAGAAAGGRGGPARFNSDYRPNDWNQWEGVLDVNTLRTFINDGRGPTGVSDSTGNYGPIALYINGPGEVRFKDIKYKDYGIYYTPKEKISSHFQMQKISDFYYSWSAAAADFNRDGFTDLVAGQHIFYGPDFTKSREIFWRDAFSPTHDFTEVNCQYAYDFNGDGWPDVLVAPAGGNLYINPKGESRRWDKFNVINGVISEVSAFQDIDGDGKPELVYSRGQTVRYAKPDPSDPTKLWIEHTISDAGGNGHGIGVGDINGDGRMDIVNPSGWWEQPATGADKGLWIFHAQAFGRSGHRGSGAGGATMAVYDVNGDGLNDVVTSLSAHGFGLAWYEQKRDASGNISFVTHMIMDDYSTKNTGGVTFAELHGSTFADIDGDGIPDFIVGKRYFSHLESSLDPDTFGPPVLYVFHTVRDPKAPGGARFVPELIHNRSGVGSSVLAADLDKNGTMDIITATSRGTFIFWNKTKGKGKATAKAKHVAASAKK